MIFFFIKLLLWKNIQYKLDFQKQIIIVKKFIVSRGVRQVTALGVVTGLESIF